MHHSFDQANIPVRRTECFLPVSSLQDVPDTYIESTNPAEALTPDQQRQASLDRLAAELYPRRLWSFARCEAAAEALLRRKEREWRKMVDFAVDARAQAGAAARALLEAALRKVGQGLTLFPGPWFLESERLNAPRSRGQD